MLQHWCTPRAYMILSSIWMNSTDTVGFMCSQLVCVLVEYFNELHWCCGVDVPSASMCSCPVFEWTQLMLWCWCAFRVYMISSSTQIKTPLMLWCWCALREYVISSGIWMNLADIMVSMCPQVVCGLVQYLNKLSWGGGVFVPSACMWSCPVLKSDAVVLMCPQVVRDLVQHLNEFSWHCGVDVPSGSTWPCAVNELC